MKEKLYKHRLLIVDGILLFLIAFNLICTKPPAEVNGLTLKEATYDTADFEWSPAENADRYSIYRSENGEDYETIATTTNTHFKDKNLITGNVYYYSIASANGAKRTVMDREKGLEVKPSLDKPKLKATTKNGVIELKISEVDGATGYVIYRDGKKIKVQRDVKYRDKSKNDVKHTYTVTAYRKMKGAVAYSEKSKNVSAELVSVGHMDATLIGDTIELTWTGNDKYSQYQLYNGKDLMVETAGKQYVIDNVKADDEFRLKLIGSDGKNQSPPLNWALKVVEEDMTTEDAINEACDWGVMIANDDDFVYGTGRRAHRFGCYFCGTNTGPNKNIKGKSLVNGHSYEMTYCCNPFVTACFAHGAGDPDALAACRRGSGFDNNEASFRHFSGWTKLKTKPALGDLRRGDVIVKPNHMALYIGDGNYVQASANTWGPESISVSKLRPKRYGKFKFVMRYTGNGRGKKLVLKEIKDEKPKKSVQ